MKQYKAVIFDLDGTLLDTLEDLTDSVNHCMEKYGFPQHSRKEVRSFVGNGIRKLIERAIPDGMKNPLYEEVYQEMAVYYKEHSQVKTRAYDGILSLLQELSKNGYQLAIVSNKNHDAAKILADLYFKDYISVVIGATDEVLKKPAPDMAIKALQELGITPDQAIYVGDSDVDAATAVNACMDCVLVTWGFRDKEFLSNCTYKAMIDHPKELLSII